MQLKQQPAAQEQLRLLTVGLVFFCRKSRQKKSNDSFDNNHDQLINQINSMTARSVCKRASMLSRGLLQDSNQFEPRNKPQEQQRSSITQRCTGLVSTKKQSKTSLSIRQIRLSEEGS